MSRPAITVTYRLPAPALELLASVGELHVVDRGRALTRDELHDAVPGSDGVVTLLSDRVDDPFLDAAGPQLRVVANVAVGYDNIDVDACRGRGVLVTNTPGVLTDATADIAIALILIVTRRLGEAERMIRSGADWKWTLDFHLGTGLRGKTLGIVGLGQIGRATAERASAFGMSIVYTGRRQVDPAVEAALGARFLPLSALLAESDIVSIHCPLRPDTTHLIGGPELAAMKPTAYLVNTSRGAVVDEEALVQALRGGVIAGAGLDVFEHEPSINPGLFELENAVLIPHLGSATVETRTAMAVLAAENVVAVLQGFPPITPIVPATRV